VEVILLEVHPQVFHEVITALLPLQVRHIQVEIHHTVAEALEVQVPEVARAVVEVVHRVVRVVVVEDNF